MTKSRNVIEFLNDFNLTSQLELAWLVLDRTPGFIIVRFTRQLGSSHGSGGQLIEGETQAIGLTRSILWEESHRRTIWEVEELGSALNVEDHRRQKTRDENMHDKSKSRESKQVHDTFQGKYFYCDKPGHRKADCRLPKKAHKKNICQDINSCVNISLEALNTDALVFSLAA